MTERGTFGRGVAGHGRFPSRETIVSGVPSAERQKRRGATLIEARVRRCDDVEVRVEEERGDEADASH